MTIRHASTAAQTAETKTSQVLGFTPAGGEGKIDDAKAYAIDKLKQLTIEEKVLLLTGSDTWRTNAIARLGIPKIKTSDGPVGVRGGLWADGVSAASLPTGVSLAATWDHEILRDVSKVLIAECKSKEVDVLLGPTVCIPRTPLGGRNFEAYSEDPFLTGKLAATYINTIQNSGIGTCIKHFAANDQETRRFFVDAKIPERALREIHLQPFQIAIRESAPWCVMTAYNKVNGTFCSSNVPLLKDILRGEWGWNGMVMSDWFGTNSIVPAVEAGVDLEMPGPVRRRGKHLLKALEKNIITESAIDKCAMKVLELVHKTGKSNIPSRKEGQERAVDLPEHREILRRSGAEGIVLLKNEKRILPLRDLNGKRIAFIGPNAARSVATGGGSSNVLPHYRTTPFESFAKEVSSMYSDCTVKTAPGIQMHRYLPLIEPMVMNDPITSEFGFTISFWTNIRHSGDPVFTEHRSSSHLICYDGLPKELTTGARYSYRARTILTPRTTGNHQISFSTCGPGRLILNNEVIINIERHWWSPKSPLFMSYGSPEVRVEVHMEANRPYELMLESVSREPKPYEITYTGELEREEVQDGGRVGFLEKVNRDLLAEAIELAKSSDIVVLVVGRDADWETESSDMESLDLPGQSNDLISIIAKTNRNVILVNQSGTPVAMPWIEDISAVLQAWYQGQEQGNSIADILLGRRNPCGKLPITFPYRIEDNPSYDNFPGENDRAYYGEGIFSGYRYYDHRKIKPLFPFGAGLSFTTFGYSNIRLSSTLMTFTGDSSDHFEVMVDVRNTGNMPGKEIVQFYVSQVSKSGLVRPPRELKGWAKVHIECQETVTVCAILDRVAVSYWDDGPNKWVVDGNAVFEVIAAKDSRDPGISATFRTAGKHYWVN